MIGLHIGERVAVRILCDRKIQAVDQKLCKPIAVICCIGNCFFFPAGNLTALRDATVLRT